MGGWHVGISSFSDRKEDAWKFVRYIISYEAQKKLALNLGWNPGRQDVYSDPEIAEKLPHLVEFRQIFENAVTRPNLPFWPEVSQILQIHINSVLAGRSDPEEALRNAQSGIDKVLQRYASEDL
jgi:multiple sugar transport system substrate-binding protein